MRAKRKVGRPKTLTPKVDLGTIELRRKRQNLVTMEALDLALERTFISSEQHEAGLRLRWLYCLQYGAPSVAAYDPDGRFSGVSVANRHDEVWLKIKAEEYVSALDVLDSVGAKRIVLWVVVFDKRPLFLRYQMRELLASASLYVKAKRELDTLQQGFEVLETFFTSSARKLGTSGSA